MKVLFINNFFPPEYIGGAEISAFYSTYGLRQRGVDCSVLSIYARAASEERREYVFKDIPVRRVALDHRSGSEWERIYDPAVYHEVVAELERARPDLVHIHNVSGASLASFQACRALGVPVVVTLHDYWMLCPNNMLLKDVGKLCDPETAPSWCRNCYRRYDFWGNVPFRREIIRWFVRDVRCFISPSQCLVDLHGQAGYPVERFRVLKSGIELGLFGVPTSLTVQQAIDLFQRAGWLRQDGARPCSAKSLCRLSYPRTLRLEPRRLVPLCRWVYSSGEGLGRGQGRGSEHGVIVLWVRIQTSPVEQGGLLSTAGGYGGTVCRSKVARDAQLGSYRRPLTGWQTGGRGFMRLFHCLHLLSRYLLQEREQVPQATKAAPFVGLCALQRGSPLYAGDAS